MKYIQKRPHNGMAERTLETPLQANCVRQMDKKDQSEKVLYLMFLSILPSSAQAQAPAGLVGGG